MPPISLPPASVLTTLAATTAACAIGLGVASSYLSSYHQTGSIARSKARAACDARRDDVYPQDILPGGRDVNTPYSTIRVFEWGPEDGEKVVVMHGIGTPSLGYADLTNEFVAKGYRVMTFDYFGRGYSDSPADLPHDTRLYLTQLLLVLASSPLPWTGNAAFHLVGFSLGGGLAVSIAAHYPHLLRSLILICPGGLVRSSRLAISDRLVYSTNCLPDWLLRIVMRWRLNPGKKGSGKDVPVEFEGEKEGEEQGDMPSWEDLMRWHLEKNEGFVAAYLSTFQHAPIYDQHEKDWKTLSKLLDERRRKDPPPGLMGGKICAVLGDKDIYVPKDEWMADAKSVLGEEAVEVHVLDGGHEIAIANGKEVAQLAMTSWTERAVEG